MEFGYTGGLFSYFTSNLSILLGICWVSESFRKMSALFYQNKLKTNKKPSFEQLVNSVRKIWALPKCLEIHIGFICVGINLCLC